MEVKNWKDAGAWVVSANNGLDEPIDERPFWFWDSGFKLNYDGSLVSVVSNFYPPASLQKRCSSLGPEWSGTLTINFNDRDKIEKDFSCKTLDDLKFEVKSYVDTITKKINDFLKTLQKGEI